MVGEEKQVLSALHLATRRRRSGRRRSISCNSTSEPDPAHSAAGHHARGFTASLRNSGFRQAPSKRRYRCRTHRHIRRARNGFPDNLELRAHCQCRDHEATCIDLPGSRVRMSGHLHAGRAIGSIGNCPKTPLSTKSAAFAKSKPPSTVSMSRRSLRHRKNGSTGPNTRWYRWWPRRS